MCLHLLVHAPTKATPIFTKFHELSVLYEKSSGSFFTDLELLEYYFPLRDFKIKVSSDETKCTLQDAGERYVVITATDQLTKASRSYPYVGF